MNTKLFLTGIEVYAYHGLFEEENKLGQKFIFDVECELDYTRAMKTDDMNDSVSYGDIAELIARVATKSKFNLLERLAGEILTHIFKDFPSITSVKLKINKPNAPVKVHFEQCGLIVEAKREDYL